MLTNADRDMISSSMHVQTTNTKTIQQATATTPVKRNLVTGIAYNILIFSIAAVPMFSLFAAHECASIGYFLSTTVRCGIAEPFSPISPVWSHLFLVLYYYSLTKYCTFIES
jgi:hypothetical protein